MVKLRMKLNGFGYRLASARKDKRLTQEQIAQLLDVSQQRYSPWEKGKAGKQIEPPYDILIKLSEILGVSIEWLIKGESSPNSSNPDLEVGSRMIRSRAIRSGETISETVDKIRKVLDLYEDHKVGEINRFQETITAQTKKRKSA